MPQINGTNKLLFHFKSTSPITINPYSGEFTEIDNINSNCVELCSVEEPIGNNMWYFVNYYISFG